jgi:hypothetical protein
MISFVTWKWKVPGYARQFEADHVNILGAMIRRHYLKPHRFICVTDDYSGLDAGVETMALPVSFHELANPQGPRFPSCYRRLWNFSKEAAVLGERILALDIDVVITGELEPLVERDDDFVSWTDPRFGWHKVPGGIYLLRTGAHTDVWESFDPHRSPAIAAAAGCKGSDQAWMSYKLHPAKAAWTTSDGLYSMKWLPKGTSLPSGVRVVSTPGDLKPWSPVLQAMYPWIRKHWRA